MVSFLYLTIMSQEKRVWNNPKTPKNFLLVSSLELFSIDIALCIVSSLFSHSPLGIFGATIFGATTLLEETEKI